MSEESGSSITANAGPVGHDYTQIDVTHDGKIVLEFNMWDGTLNGHVKTVLRLFPGEARLFSDMLNRNADAAVDPAATTPV